MDMHRVFFGNGTLCLQKSCRGEVMKFLMDYKPETLQDVSEEDQDQLPWPMHSESVRVRQLKDIHFAPGAPKSISPYGWISSGEFCFMAVVL